MVKHIKRTLQGKVKIVREYKAGASISYLCEKYNISGNGNSKVLLDIKSN